MNTHARRRRGRIMLALVLLAARRGHVLDLDARRKVYNHVRRYPGLHLREIGRGCDMDPNHVKYHLRYLEKHGLVSSRRSEGYWRFWPKEETSVGYRERLSRDDKRIVAALRRPVPLHVVLLIADGKALSLSNITEEVGAAKSTLHYHLSRLEQKGILDSERVGRERQYRLKDATHVLSLLLRHRPPPNLVAGFLDAWEDLEVRRSDFGLGRSGDDGAEETEGRATDDPEAGADEYEPVRGEGGAGGDTEQAAGKGSEEE